MKFLQSLVLLLIVCGSSFNIKAQVDCSYGLKFLIKDEAGKTIEDAKLELVNLDTRIKLPSYVKLIRIDDAYIFRSHAGQTINGDFQVNISAPGYEIYQQRVNFPTCKIQNFDIKLKFLLKEQKTSILAGNVYDARGSLITYAKITAINERGQKFETETNNDGGYILDLPYNLYSSGYKFKITSYEITVTKENFDKLVLKNFKFVPAFDGKMRLDFALDVFVNINTIIIEKNNNEKEK